MGRVYPRIPRPPSLSVPGSDGMGTMGCLPRCGGGSSPVNARSDVQVADPCSRGDTEHVQTGSVQLTISVPAALADSGAGERARGLLVLDAVRSERMTWRAAATALGLAPSSFLDLARDHGVPVVRVSAADVADDFTTLDRLGSPRRP